MKIRSLLTEEQKKKYDQMDQRPETARLPPRFTKSGFRFREGRPVPVDITTGISDGSFTEVISGALKEGQEIIVEATGGNNKSGSSPPQPSMRGIR